MDNTAEREAQIKFMASRFLGWRLPEDFHPDAGINFTPGGKHQPIGTNLFNAPQAEAMVRHMLDGLTVRPASAGEADYQAWALAQRDEIKPEGTREALEGCAAMLEKWGPECCEANEGGQIPFVRSMTEATAAEIRAYLAATASSNTAEPEVVEVTQCDRDAVKNVVERALWQTSGTDQLTLDRRMQVCEELAGLSADVILALPRATQSSKAMVEALERYADPANWHVRNSSGPGWHQMGEGSMERHAGQPGTITDGSGALMGGQFLADAGSRARAALTKDAPHE